MLSKKKNILLSLSLAVVFISVVYIIVFLNLKPAQNQLVLVRDIDLKELSNNQALNKYTGEKIVYNVRMGNVTLGKSVFNRLQPVELDGKMVNLMSFETRLARFSDKEKIYSAAGTFLPLKIEREISNWPFLEKISEQYDQDKFTLTIIKTKGKVSEERVIRKDGPIHNSIILPFVLRDIPELAVGWSMAANLPGQKFEIKLSSLKTLKLPAGEFKAYHFESNPSKFEIWVSADERRIPLKIKGAGPLGYTLVMKEYKLGNNNGSMVDGR